MKLCVKNLEKRYLDPINELSYDNVLQLSDDGVLLNIEQCDEFSVSFDGKCCTIKISHLHQLFYGLMLLKSEDKPFCKKLQDNFTQLSFMMDCSRNKVMTVPAAKKMIRTLALLGYDAMHLYMEDTYQMEGYPYFGYMRGRFSKEQLKELDSYAKMFGVELIASIQTLAHLNCALRWNAHRDMLDLQDVLLADYDRTYQFIEDMLKNLSESLTSRRINIGMDEAYLLGYGKYRELHGEVDQHKIMLSHLNRVYALCEKYGYKPMMWADMFFRIAGDGKYENVDQSVSLEKFKDIPKGVTPIYWDYVTTDSEKYDYYMQQLKSISENCCFAGAAYKWAGVVPNNRFSLNCTKTALDCALKNGITDIMATGWGDDGDEASAFAVLPSISYYGSRRYGSENYKPVLDAAINIDSDLLLMLDEPCYTCGNDSLTAFNPWRYALYQDPLCGLFDFHIKKGDNASFKAIADKISAVKKSAGEYAYLLDTIEKLCCVLSVKAELGLDLRSAYQQGDKAALKDLTQQITLLIPKVNDYRKAIRTQWLKEANGCGFEYVDIKVAGVAARLQSAIDRINDYLEGNTPIIEELEQEPLPVEPYLANVPHRSPVWAGNWRNIVTGGSIW
ncbi:MAG: beta-N-acetylhexosaminidase [Clostridia bacterium]|nr:beta-N-acetylhexosaminidase [Clostridia bacterium]